jgi:hypothetical protein
MQEILRKDVSQLRADDVGKRLIIRGMVEYAGGVHLKVCLTEWICERCKKVVITDDPDTPKDMCICSKKAKFRANRYDLIEQKQLFLKNGYEPVWVIIDGEAALKPIERHSNIEILGTVDYSSEPGDNLGLSEKSRLRFLVRADRILEVEPKKKIRRY